MDRVLLAVVCFRHNHRTSKNGVTVLERAVIRRNYGPLVSLPNNHMQARRKEYASEATGVVGKRRLNVSLQ
jgi:hypothetical protein